MQLGAHPLAGAEPKPGIAGVMKAVASGAVRALVLDAREPLDYARAHELLRTLYDDPRRPERRLHPRRVLAVVATGDVEAAFALGRYGIAGVLEERDLERLPARLDRIAAQPSEGPPMIGASTLTTPALAPARSSRLGPHVATAPPTVAIGHRHAPATLDVLARYQRVLHAEAHASSVFDDVATLLDVMLAEDLTCQTNLATKAGATHSGQFIGSFDFYRELRRTRYARIPEHPRGEVAMEVFIAVDEVIHEVLHLLFLANALRAGREPAHTHLAEELSLTWWQAVVHQRVWGDWLADRALLEINDDFMLCEAHADRRGFWTVGHVFDRYVGYPWVPFVVASLPERGSYIGERPDLGPLTAHYASRAESAFLAARPERLRVPGGFGPYPSIPEALRVAH